MSFAESLTVIIIIAYTLGMLSLSVIVYFIIAAIRRKWKPYKWYIILSLFFTFLPAVLMEVYFLSCYCYHHSEMCVRDELEQAHLDVSLPSFSVSDYDEDYTYHLLDTRTWNIEFSEPVDKGLFRDTVLLQDKHCHHVSIAASPDGKTAVVINEFVHHSNPYGPSDFQVEDTVCTQCEKSFQKNFFDDDDDSRSDVKTVD